MSDNPKLLLVTLGAKIRELMRRHEELKERAEAMEMHIAEQSEEISALRKELEEMNIKYRNLKTAKGLAFGDSDVREARNRFNKLVREIDKCISLLNE
ncbi:MULTISPECIES: hypothetical protein [Bacteroidales]|jgi:hypothetical protein|uniref:hypothetical protein n=1 Tax=Bacteroidales TaxID=171549 RepID=UPI000573871B|nr:hypothetical protein [Gabonia massiliensis]KHM48534.1 hypothetical protein PU94_02355 [Coprobacter secundus]